MNPLLNRFIQICLFKSGPEDLPKSTFLLMFAFVGYGLAGLLLSLSQSDLKTAILMVLVDIILLAILGYLLLTICTMTERYIQTLTALAGSSALLAFVAWPLVLWQQQATNNSESNGMLLLVSLLLWGWFFWNLSVFSHIIRQAISTRLPIGVGLAVLYMYISFTISKALFYPVTP